MNAPDIDQLVSRRAALAGLGVGALAFALARRGVGARAQGATPTPRDGHAIVGVWQAPPDSYTALGVAVYEPTGLYLECGVFLDPTIPTAGIGARRPIDDRTVEVVLVDRNIFALEPFFVFDQPLPGYLPAGFAPRIRKTIELDESGNRAAGVQHFIDEEGKDIVSTYTAGSSVRLIPSGDLAG